MTEEATALEGRRREQFEPSRYLDYLPAMYRQDDFMGRFLLIFETIMAPLEGVVDQLPRYLDPTTCPAEILPYLAHWVALELDERWSMPRRRSLIKVAAELHRWRGTRRGLKTYLQVVTGVTPLLIENTDGSRLGADNRLGLNIRLGRPVEHYVKVTLPLAEGEAVDVTDVAALLDAEKPAHIIFSLHIVPRQPRLGQGGGANGPALFESAATEEA